MNTEKAAKFPAGSQLRVLDLNYGAVRSVKAGAFSTLRQLAFVGLCDNRLSQKALDELVSELPLGVAELLVGGNDLGEVKERQFSRLANLETLDLHRNALVSLPACAFCGLDELSAIYLQGNEFRRVPSAALQSTKRLRLLNLSHNPLCRIDAVDFAGLRRMQSLLLLGCCAPNVTIDDNPASCMPNLTSVHISTGKFPLSPAGSATTECEAAEHYATSCDDGGGTVGGVTGGAGSGPRDTAGAKSAVLVVLLTFARVVYST
ncbi:PREDICTED: leucine-rich repeat neuronal protein 1-like [Priapulus caudatus]|uniref:Leucine-rich repeat neuronal protein 1-like n=1 Tax=Priapulus caudatus TaxID=37621 RepID=A0ABM1E8P1_PRICU|nr:PREDICTED: leucine-rich repeat neuronal protein 1-like [Priapulus caudatus]